MWNHMKHIVRASCEAAKPRNVYELPETLAHLEPSNQVQAGTNMEVVEKVPLIHPSLRAVEPSLNLQFAGILYSKKIQ